MKGNNLSIKKGTSTPGINIKLGHKTHNIHRKVPAPFFGFTLVELIVVITILAILGTIAIMAFSGYSKNARDSARISDVANIKKVLELWILKSGTYPETTNGTGVTFTGGLTLWNQGTFGDSVFNTVSKLEKKPVDPLYDTEYTYSVINSKKEYELGAVLESELAVKIPGIPQSYAATESKKAYVSGTYNGILATTNTIPAYIVALPSIILSDLSNTQIDGLTSVNLVYNNRNNLPSSYKNKNLTMTGENLGFTPKVVWSSSTGMTALNNQEEFQTLVTNLQNVYNSGTLFATLPEYKTIASETGLTSTAIGMVKTIIETNTKTELNKVSTTPIFHNCVFNNSPVNVGQSITAYQTETVSYGNTCISEQRTCANGVLGGTYMYSTCSVDGATGTFTLGSNSVTAGTNVNISNTCSLSPSSYTSSNTSVATVSGTTITTLSAGTTNITPVGGGCGDSAAKTLTVLPICNQGEDNSTGVCTDPYWNNVTLLMHMNGSNNSTSFIDEKGHLFSNLSPSITDDTYITTEASVSCPFGGSCFKSGVSYNYNSIKVDDHNDFELKNSDFTIEFWYKAYTSTPWYEYSTAVLMGKGFGGNPNGPTSTKHSFWIANNNNSTLSLILWTGTNVYGVDMPISSTLTQQWHHYAFVRNGTNLYSFMDGILKNTTVVPGTTSISDLTAKFTIGGFYGYTSDSDFPRTTMKGYLDEIRITKFSRYNSNFTPPLQAFPHQ